MSDDRVHLVFRRHGERVVMDLQHRPSVPISTYLKEAKLPIANARIRVNGVTARLPSPAPVDALIEYLPSRGTST